ncbi:MAG: DNA replication/repair protein RecF [Butyrivibrio sp.]
MIIKSIDLKNFRNYEIEHIDFDEGTNIFYGDNAQGKTNILEAVYISGTGKSHKGSKDFELINFECEESHIKTIISRKNIDYRIDMHIKKNKAKGIAVNGIPVKKTLDLYGIVNIIFFSPEDLNIIKNGPAGRRKFMDMELCQLNRLYGNHLVNYNKSLDQRNRLLKDIYFRDDLKDTLDIWDGQLVKYGVEIIRARRNFINKINSIIYDIHEKLSGGKEKLTISYEPSVSEEELERVLIRERERDIKMKVTQAGPHRDDIIFMINDVDIRKYGSQGQQRTAALSLKLAEIEIVKEITGDKPVLLLDDVLSELDSNRQNYLLNSINDVQTIITCTGLDEFINNRFNINSIFKVINGQVFKEN